MSEERQHGECRCGSVRFEASGPPMLTVACHCRGCQKMSSSAFSLSSAYRADQFKLLDGETVIGGLRGATQHHFCPSCMTWIFTRPDGLDWLVNVRSTMFEYASKHQPYADMYRAEGLAWVSSGAIRSFDGAPEEREIAAMISDFAEWHTEMEG